MPKAILVTLNANQGKKMEDEDFEIRITLRTIMGAELVALRRGRWLIPRSAIVPAN